MGGRGSRSTRMRMVLQSSGQGPENQQGPAQVDPAQSDGTQKITDPQDLLKFFEHADDKAAQAMLAQWRATPLDADGRQQDNDVQRFFNYIGWTSEEPEVLTEAQYQQALQQAGNPEQLYHADEPYGPVGARQFAAQFMGRASDAAGNKYRQFMSGGIHGAGTYFAPSARHSAMFGISQFRGFLNSKVKMIGEGALDRQLAAFEGQHPAFRRVMDNLTNAYGAPGNRHELKSIFAAMLGYNAIRAQYHNNFVTLLDRSALTMSEQTRKTHRGTSADVNW